MGFRASLPRRLIAPLYRKEQEIRGLEMVHGSPWKALRVAPGTANWLGTLGLLRRSSWNELRVAPGTARVRIAA